ncbi:MAG: RsmB/NOP family class I SAM-dependent RNA methyltransferase [Alphaproteobacteria bacterium]|nr:RsmB/NOP family class I SAM-dependent RNA methyltransferase [Alphaproteobacteria bacterium]
MRAGARLQAAIEILDDVSSRKRPPADAVKDWMLSHRFAGSKDRAEIGDLVFGALRWRASSAFRLGSDGSRAWVLGAVRWGFGRDLAWFDTAFTDDPHAPPAPDAAERAALETATLDGAPPHVRGDYPEWLDASLARVFGEARAEEGAALAAPAPLDLRANRLKTDRDALIAALANSPRLVAPPTPTPFAPDGVRIPWSQGRTFPWATEQAFQKGWFEVQDEGSQLAALAVEAGPGLQVADVCAGGGGKTLALAAAMAGKGQIYAYDIDGRRLAPLHERLARAGVRNAQIRTPRRDGGELADLAGRMDVALVDAPCTGSGTWRRAPDSKWRLRPAALDRRRAEQQDALTCAAALVKPGGRLVYVTCSVLPEENDDAVAALLARDAAFAPAPERRRPGALADAPDAALGTTYGLQMTPRRTGCDGFYVAVLVRR